MDPADQGIDQHVDDALAELVGHERSNGAVPDRPAAMGSGQHGIAGEAQRTADAHDAGTGRGPEPGRYPEGMALGQGTQVPAGPYRRTPGRNGHKRVGQSHLPAQVDRLTPTPEEAVWPQIDHAPTDFVALEGSTELG